LVPRFLKFSPLLLISLFLFQGNQPFNNEIKLYRFSEADRRTVNSIEKSGGSVSKYFPGKFVEVYLNDKLFYQLKNSGIDLVQIPDRDKIYADSLYEATRNSKNPMAGYHTYQEITDTLTIWSQQFSNIAELHSIGKTVQGRDMWIMKISDNVSNEEVEPEFKYISTMHGDEVVGKEMLIELIRLLLFEYGSNQRITDLVNNTEIWIMPNMNFDGTEASYPSQRRNNANGVNLNRNFPDREYGYPPFPGHPYVIQPETQNMIDFTAQHNFILSANFHGGTLVANYPWDKRLPGDGGVAPYAGSPDDTTFIDLALTYAERNPPMYNSSIFQNGITNGAAWYEISGGMQDWNYFEHDCMEITMEVSNIKWPPDSTLPQFWLDNKESLLAYMEKVHTGVKGIVTDSSTSLPIPAFITVLETGSGIGSDSDFGDYYKVISPGIYDLVFTADGYKNKTIFNVQVDSFPATIVDVQLNPEIIFNVDGQITDLETSQPLENVEVSFIKNGNIIYRDSSNVAGYFQTTIEPDSIIIRLNKESYKSILDTIEIISDSTLIYKMQKIYPTIITGSVTSTIGASPGGAIIYCQGISDTLDNSGYFYLDSIPTGNISVFAYLHNHKTNRIDTMITNGDSLHFSIILEYGTNEIFENFEESSSIIHGSSGDWEIGIPSSGPMGAYSGVNLWATNLSGNYSNGGLLSSLETSDLAILGFSHPLLEFHH